MPQEVTANFEKHCLLFSFPFNIFLYPSKKNQQNVKLISAVRRRPLGLSDSRAFTAEQSSIRSSNDTTHYTRL